eukprot:COSAG06_NODE_60545_length_270_cov_0.918129_1_plen_44_part_10
MINSIVDAQYGRRQSFLSPRHHTHKRCLLPLSATVTATALSGGG